MSSRVRVWAGALCALLVGWAACAVSVLAWSRFPFFLFGFVGPKRAIILWYWAFSLVWVGVSFFVIAFLTGALCGCFWHGASTPQERRFWIIWVSLWLVAPCLLAGALGVAVFLFVFSLAISPFTWGAEFGVRWWPKRQWRTLFGWTNEWEREPNEKIP